MATVIPDLSERFSVIAPDLCGCGDSEKVEMMPEKQTVAGDLHVLIEHLAPGPIHLAARDVGMMVGCAHAAPCGDQGREVALMKAALRRPGARGRADESRFAATDDGSVSRFSKAATTSTECTSELPRCF